MTTLLSTEDLAAIGDRCVHDDVIALLDHVATLEARLHAWEEAGRAFEVTHDRSLETWPCAPEIRALLAGKR